MYFVKQASEQGISIPETFRIKITGDKTQIARGLNIVNIVFKKNIKHVPHLVIILKIAEEYKELSSGLQDICEEAADLQIVTIQDKVYNIKFSPGRRLEMFSNCLWHRIG